MVPVRTSSGCCCDIDEGGKSSWVPLRSAFCRPRTWGVDSSTFGLLQPLHQDGFSPTLGGECRIDIAFLPHFEQSKSSINLVGKVICSPAQSKELPSDAGRVMQVVRSLLGIIEKFLRSSSSGRFVGAMHLHVEFCWPFAEHGAIPAEPAAAWQRVPHGSQPGTTCASSTPAKASDTGGRYL